MSECSVILGEQNPSEIKIRIPPGSGDGVFELRAFIVDGKFVLDLAAVATAVKGTTPQAYKHTGSYGPNRGVPEGPPIGYQLSAEEMAFCKEYRKTVKPEDFGVGVRQFRFDHRLNQQFSQPPSSMSDLHCDILAGLAEMSEDLYTKKSVDTEKVATGNKKRDDILREIFG